jgi:hypothetical protein
MGYARECGEMAVRLADLTVSLPDAMRVSGTALLKVKGRQLAM